MLLKKVISGSQIGADIAGLRAAKRYGLSTGGWMPKGFRAKDGFHPEYREMYGMEETEETTYPPRTHLNVVNADATCRFAYNFESPGERATLREIRKIGQPYFDIPLQTPMVVTPVDLGKWLVDNNVRVLNVAGNGDKRIEAQVEEFLHAAFEFLTYREVE